MKGQLLAFLQDLLSNALLAVMVLMLIALINIGSGGIRTVMELHTRSQERHIGSNLASHAGLSGEVHQKVASLVNVQRGLDEPNLKSTIIRFLLRIDTINKSSAVITPDIGRAILTTEQKGLYAMVFEYSVSYKRKENVLLLDLLNETDTVELSLFANSYLLNVASCSPSKVKKAISIKRVNASYLLEGCDNQ